MRVVAGNDDVLEIGIVLDDIRELRQQHLRHHQAAGAAVGEHEAIIVFGEQRVQRHRDDAGFQAAEKRGRPIDGVGERHQHALLAAQPEAAQRGGKARHPVGKLRIGGDAARIDEGRLVAAPGGEI